MMVPTCTHQAGCLKQISGAELRRFVLMITVIAVAGDMERLMRARNCQDHLSYLDLKVVIQGIVT